MSRHNKSNERPCNTIIVNGDRPGSKKFSQIEEGQAIIKTNPSSRENPCVYFKHSSTHAIHQQGNGSMQRFDPDSYVIPVRVVETHIKVPRTY